ncbi:hypothetical protein G4B88_009419 [Cannabis sativa]|uniref:RNase H type-1 domain-containing protein n=1 Tax=Cannabis sativa TaxID=3483 RepID=A0A7J6GJ15_CANSA|nr:hypothetical protein G4B88_009419 [Cannabis sativa]
MRKCFTPDVANAILCIRSLFEEGDKLEESFETKASSVPTAVGLENSQLLHASQIQFGLHPCLQLKLLLVNDSWISGYIPNPDIVFKRITLRLNEFSRLLSIDTLKEPDPKEDLRASSDIMFKVDASVLGSDAGIGVIQTNVPIKRVITLQAFRTVIGVLEEEFEAIFLCMEFCAEMQFEDVVIHSDSAMVVKAVKAKTLPYSWGPIRIKCLALLKSFNCITFVFIPHVANSDADKLAYLARVNYVYFSFVVREADPFVAAI